MLNDVAHDPADTPIVVVAHPAERRRGRSTVPAQAGHCCCCCCCCCLHSLGGIIGAAMAPNLGGAAGPRAYVPLTYYWDEEDYDLGPRALSTRERQGITEEPPAAGRTERSVRPYEEGRGIAGGGIAVAAYGSSAVSLFWWSFLALVVIGGLISVVSGAEGVLVGGVIILLVLPGLQLGAAVVAALILAPSSRADKGYQFRQLAKIVLGTLAGTILGILVMIGLYVLFTGFAVFRSGDGALALMLWTGVGAVLFALSVVGLVALSRR